jgi:hypothetical protein
MHKQAAMLIAIVLPAYQQLAITIHRQLITTLGSFSVA